MYLILPLAYVLTACLQPAACLYLSVACAYTAVMLQQEWPTLHCNVKPCWSLLTFAEQHVGEGILNYTLAFASENMPEH